MNLCLVYLRVNNFVDIFDEMEMIQDLIQPRMKAMGKLAKKGFSYFLFQKDLLPICTVLEDVLRNCSRDEDGDKKAWACYGEFYHSIPEPIVSSRVDKKKSEDPWNISPEEISEKKNPNFGIRRIKSLKKSHEANSEQRSGYNSAHSTAKKNLGKEENLTEKICEEISKKSECQFLYVFYLRLILLVILSYPWRRLP